MFGKKKKYFVSFAIKGKGSDKINGIGNVMYHCKKMTMDELSEFQDEMKKCDDRIDEVYVINFQKFK